MMIRNVLFSGRRSRSKMVDRYAILGIEDSRATERAALRRAVPLREVKIASIDGRDEAQIEAARRKWPGIRQHTERKQGELGIIYSVLNVLDYVRERGNLLVFEDDCVVVGNFWDRLETYVLDFPPADADFVCLMVPPEQRRFYYCVMNYDIPHGAEIIRELRPDEPSPFDIGHPYLARTYNTFKNVCMIWTARGATKTIGLLHRDGLWGQVDDMIMRYAARGELNGFSLKPLYRIAAESGASTLIHDTEWVESCG